MFGIVRSVIFLPSTVKILQWWLARQCQRLHTIASEKKAWWDRTCNISSVLYLWHYAQRLLGCGKGLLTLCSKSHPSFTAYQYHVHILYLSFAKNAYSTTRLLFKSLSSTTHSRSVSKHLLSHLQLICAVVKNVKRFIASQANVALQDLVSI